MALIFPSSEDPDRLGSISASLSPPPIPVLMYIWENGPIGTFSEGYWTSRAAGGVWADCLIFPPAVLKQETTVIPAMESVTSKVLKVTKRSQASVWVSGPLPLQLLARRRCRVCSMRPFPNIQLKLDSLRRPPPPPHFHGCSLLNCTRRPPPGADDSVGRLRRRKGPTGGHISERLLSGSSLSPAPSRPSLRPLAVCPSPRSCPIVHCRCCLCSDP